MCTGKTVETTCFCKGFKTSFVDRSQVDACQEVEDIPEWAVFGSFLDDALNGIFPNIFNPGHAEPDLAFFIHHEVLFTFIDVGS